MRLFIQRHHSYSTMALQSYIKQSRALRSREGLQPNLLNPYFITGFSDAESCFMVLFQKNAISKTG